MTAEEAQAAAAQAKAEADAKKKAEDDAKKRPGIINRAMQGLRDLNVWDALHPQGTGSTKRGFNDIYPKP